MTCLLQEELSLMVFANIYMVEEPKTCSLSHEIQNRFVKICPMFFISTHSLSFSSIHMQLHACMHMHGCTCTGTHSLSLSLTLSLSFTHTHTHTHTHTQTHTHISALLHRHAKSPKTAADIKLKSPLTLDGCLSAFLTLMI